MLDPAGCFWILDGIVSGGQFRCNYQYIQFSKRSGNPFNLHTLFGAYFPRDV